jgi:hypothetical protein
VSGLHFRIGSAIDLAARIEQAATEPGIWERLRAGVPRPPTIGETVETLLNLYADGGRKAAKASLPGKRVRMSETASVSENVG